MKRLTILLFLTPLIIGCASTDILEQINKKTKLLEVRIVPEYIFEEAGYFAIDFSEKIDPESVKSNVTFKYNNIDIVDIQCSVTDNLLIVTPENNLVLEGVYYLSLKREIKDIYNNNLLTDCEFILKNKYSGSYPQVTYNYPSNNSAINDGFFEVVLYFNDLMDEKTISGVSKNGNDGAFALLDYQGNKVTGSFVYTPGIMRFIPSSLCPYHTYRVELSDSALNIYGYNLEPFSMSFDVEGSISYNISTISTDITSDVFGYISNTDRFVVADNSVPGIVIFNNDSTVYRSWSLPSVTNAISLPLNSSGATAMTVSLMPDQHRVLYNDMLGVFIQWIGNAGDGKVFHYNIDTPSIPGTEANMFDSPIDMDCGLSHRIVLDKGNQRIQIYINQLISTNNYYYINRIVDISSGFIDPVAILYDSSKKLIYIADKLADKILFYDIEKDLFEDFYAIDQPEFIAFWANHLLASNGLNCNTELIDFDGQKICDLNFYGAIKTSERKIFVMDKDTGIITQHVINGGKL